MKIVGFAQLHNELEKGNLYNWFRSMQRVCDFIYIYDQASTDGSRDIYKQHDNVVVIESATNRFEEELFCKAELLQKLRQDHPDTDWIFWMDGDTILDARLTREQLEKEVKLRPKANALKLGHLNLWRSDIHYRTDSLFHWLHQHGVVALWRNHPNLHFAPTKGLHKAQTPIGMRPAAVPRLGYNLIHRGFATDSQILRRIETYESIPGSLWDGGPRQRQQTLARFLNERPLQVQEVPSICLPEDYSQEDNQGPHKKIPIHQLHKDRNLLPRVSILITSFQRPHLLKWGLDSLRHQKFRRRFEVLIANDGIEDETEEICKNYAKHLNLKYFFTGQRNLDGNIKWRIPGFALNILAKHASAPILIISCAEMYHLNASSLESLVQPIEEDTTRLTIPQGRDDNSACLAHLNAHGTLPIALFGKMKALNVQLPFAMGISRDTFFEIGGYDEDFTGVAFDDDDIVGRLLKHNCAYHKTTSQIVHLHHPRHVQRPTPPWHYNRKLYEARKNIVKRNEGREWGVQR